MNLACYEIERRRMPEPEVSCDLLNSGEMIMMTDGSNNNNNNDDDTNKTKTYDIIS